MNEVKGFTDSELVVAIADKSQLNQAILFIYKHYSAQVSSFIINNGGGEQDGEDIFQETVVAFIDLVNKGKFRQQSSVKTFLVAIARNIWLNELSRRNRAGYREKFFESSRPQEVPDVGHVVEDREMKKRFREILAKLGEPCKKILTLFYYENKSMKEIVNHLSYENDQVVRNKKSKCLQQLTKMLTQNEDIIRQI